MKAVRGGGGGSGGDGGGSSWMPNGGPISKTCRSPSCSPQATLRCRYIAHREIPSFPPTPATPRLMRLSGRVQPDTVSFEFKMAGLLALRAQRAGMTYVSNTNVAAAKPMDDVVLRVSERSSGAGRSATVFMQLHHAARDLSKADFIDKKNKLHLDKYFEFYQKYKKNHAEQHHYGPREFIYDCDLENVYFIFYTPRKRIVGELPEPVVFDVNDFFYEVSEMLTTVHGGEIFKFTERDSEVWNMHNESPETEKEYHEFLSKLYVFCSQAKSTNLFALIQMEFELKFDGQVPSSITPRYIKFLEDWATDGKQNYCLANDSYTVEWVVALHSQEIARESVHNITFQMDLKLRDFIQKHSKIIVTVPRGSRRCRVAKLMPILVECYKDRWVYLDKMFDSRYSEKAVQCMCEWCHCEVFVVNFNDLRKQNKILDYLNHTSKSKEQKGSTKPKVIVLNSEKCIGQQMPGEDWCEYTDEWNLKELVEESKAEIMSRKLLFQGKEIIFQELVAAWPILNKMDIAELLSAIMSDGASLGKELPVVDMPLARTLVHKSVLNATVLKFRSDTDHLVLSGFPRSVLETIGRDMGVRNVEENDRWTVMNSESETRAEELFKSVCTRVTRRRATSVHWLECVAGDSLHDLVIVWRATRGRADALEKQGLVLKATPSCTNSQWCAHEPSEKDSRRAERDAAAWGPPRALLVAEAGSGKTAFMLRAAAAAQEQHSTCWVVFVPVLEQLSLLRELPEPENLTVQHAVELLSAAAGVAEAGSSVEWRCFVKAVMEVGNALVFVDGVDEVCPAHEAKVIRILQLLWTRTKATRIWVSTRPEMERPLSRALQCTSVYLRPLSSEQQQTHLCEYWGNRHRVPASRFAEFAAAVVNSIAPPSGQRHDDMPTRRSLLDTPQHLQMVAEEFSAQAVESLNNTRGSSLLEKRRSSLLELHRKIVERKNDLFMQQHGLRNANFENSTYSEDNEFYTRHQMSAMYCLFQLLKDSPEFPHKKTFEEYLEQNRSIMKKEKTGIFWMQGNWEPVFIHPSFMEYFAAMWLCSHNKTCAVNEFLKHIDVKETVEMIKEFLKDFEKKGTVRKITT